VAAHGRGARCYGHGDMDRRRAAQAFWDIQRTVAGARFASCNLWHSAFAGFGAYWARLESLKVGPTSATVILTVAHTVLGALLFAFSILIVLMCSDWCRAAGK